MKNGIIVGLALMLSVCLPIRAQAEPSLLFLNAFVTASEQARQPDATQDEVEAYLAFMADDLVDHHIAYARSFHGKAHLRGGIKQKAMSMVSISQSIESIVLGSSTAIVVVTEDSEYYKDEKLKRFQGRTILVLEFDEDGLISQMRRYLD